jgi:hypothetical protein
MKNRLFLLASLLALLLAACAPSERVANNAPTLAAVNRNSTPSPGPVESSSPMVGLTATSMLELLSATHPVDALPIATSRGPELHATDPATVSLASGGLQFVEFFRFT